MILPCFLSLFQILGGQQRSEFYGCFGAEAWRRVGAAAAAQHASFISRFSQSERRSPRLLSSECRQLCLRRTQTAGGPRPPAAAAPENQETEAEF